jgi:hypothetical protein
MPSRAYTGGKQVKVRTMARISQTCGGSSRPSLRMLVLHDDEDREFDYIAGAEMSVKRAQAEGWTIISMRDDWATVFVPSLATGRV